MNILLTFFLYAFRSNLKHYVQLKMKLGIICTVFSLLAGCAPQGQYRNSYDEFSKETRSSVSLGRLVVNKADGFLTVVTGSFDEVRSADSAAEYFYNFSVYSENASRRCPYFKKGARAIFLLDEEAYEYRVHSKTKLSKPLLGLLMSSCVENNIVIGPLTREFIQRSLQHDVIRFKLYGENSDVEGRILKEEIEEIRSHLSMPKPT